MEIDIEVWKQRISELFNKYKIERVAESTFREYLRKPAPSIKTVNSEKLRKKLNLIFWAVQGVQIELGYMLIAFESYKTTRMEIECKIMTSNEYKRTKEKNWLSYMLFVHHYFMAIECIYRVWERFSHIFNYIHTGKEKKEGYYGDIINKLEKSGRYNETLISGLKEHQKNCDKITELRNEYSHEYSSLVDKIGFEVFFSPILNLQGNNILEIKGIQRDLRNDINSIKQKLEYFKKLNASLDKFLKEVN